MEIIIISLVAAGASLLTFFSGFGLGTLLTPVLAVFFPLEIAIALTGIVHLLNNFFKLILVGKAIDWQTGIKFGLTATVGAYLGAQVLINLSFSYELISYSIKNQTFIITLDKLIIASLMVIFALFELVPTLKNMQFEKNKIYVGGILSGFFGGLSGHQGALRSAFLIRFGLTKESFIATGILIACFIDVTRLSVYFTHLSSIQLSQHVWLLLFAVLSAFGGAYIGSKLLKKVTLSFVQFVVASLILIIALALGAGLI